MIEIRHDSMSDTQSTQAAYNELFAGELLVLRDSYYHWLLDRLDLPAGRRLLDISCGHGRLVTFAQQRGINAMGVDFAEDGLRYGQESSADSGWLVGDGERLPIASASFDAITHIGSLEHYQNMDAGASEMARVLKPGGRALVLLPNAFSLTGNLWHVLRNGTVFDDGQPLQRIASRAAWQAVLENNGLKVLKTIGYGEVQRPQTRADWIWMLKKPVKVIRLFVNLFVPLNLTNHFVFICTRD
jgi:SAM-dependent methyltransferase